MPLVTTFVPFVPYVQGGDRGVALGSVGLELMICASVAVTLVLALVSAVMLGELRRRRARAAGCAAP